MTSFLSVEDRFAALVENMLQQSDVTYGGEKKGFGSSALKVNGKIFAMLTNERLVIKLPRQRVTALVEAGEGTPLDTGNGRVMKEWLSLNPESDQGWQALAQEALAFVGKT